ncbi:hypothetical protein AMC83_CH01955 [Rhizobium phaseoli]|uniref:hypothetical protein n=1 Tax=Rhizobium phaseoli TaxID=396 RepID=UPI0007E9D883|nr:hypothetical protein [Rhizobium phaseoli]ANL71938.1 hypothetical protein AMC83_CH01955 [Rhizobium phaseoli]
MATKSSPENQWFVKLLDERFDRLHNRIDAMEEGRERRDRDVNLMDTINKAEIKTVKDRVIAVETELGNVRYLLKAAVWAVSALGAVLSWAFDLYGHITTAIRSV